MKRFLLPLTVASLAFAALGACATTAPTAAQAQQGEADRSRAQADLLRYLRGRGSTGLVVLRDGEVVINEAWRAPDDLPLYLLFLYGHTADGALLEDVASQQKSFIAVLMAIAIDRGLLDVEQPVSAYLGEGWSQATSEQETAIRVIDIMTMSSGLDERFRFEAPAGTVFFYNTPVYAVAQQILVAASGEPLDVITRDWLTVPAGMVDTGWRRRPAALAAVGNSAALVTTPVDVARFGQMILRGGVSVTGERVVSDVQLNALFERSATNPAYGRLWWLNGGEYRIGAAGARRDGPLIPAAPADLVGAYGAFDRRLYVVPSLDLVVVRTGAATNDRDFDQEFWLRLNAVLD